MTLRIYSGGADDITARLAAPPAPLAAVVTAVAENVLTVTDASGLAVNDTLLVGRTRVRVIALDEQRVTVTPTPAEAAPGLALARYDADLTRWRVGEGRAPDPLSFIDDREQPRGGDNFGRTLSFTDYDGAMPEPREGWRLCIFDDTAPARVLFSGVVARVEKTPVAVQRGGGFMWRYGLDVRGWQDEADSLLIDEPPFVNINSGKFLRYLLEKYTTLAVGEIDEVNSPVLGRVRLQRGKRFSDVLRDLNTLWPDGEAFVGYGRGTGVVYFRRRTSSPVPFTIDAVKITDWGPQKVSIERDASKTYNIVELPFYLLRPREREVFTQPATGDPAFLQTSVLLSGIPSNIEEADLIVDDFSRDSFGTLWSEYDRTNPAPPTGFTGSDGYILTGRLNDVPGCHLLPAPGSTVLGDLGVMTNPVEIEPWTGDDRQVLYAQEIVVNALGEAVLFGIINQTTRTETVRPGSTTSLVNVATTDGFVIGDRVIWSGLSRTVINLDLDTLILDAPLPVVPGVGTTITRAPLSLPRVLIGLHFNADGSLTLIKDGVDVPFSTPRTYTAPTTYSVRYFMRRFETQVESATATSANLADVSNVSAGDWVEIYTRGGRSAPELRQVLSVDPGGLITYAATDSTPSPGYPVRTLPKLTIQIKGGIYGAITGRDWTTIHVEPNSWRSSYASEGYGVALAIQRTLALTIPLFQVKNPVSITAEVGNRYLHIGTQEVDSSEPDVDCIVRRVGSKYQLDFFPDTKTLWGSGNRLVVTYDEKQKQVLTKSDTPSIFALAEYRGHVVTGLETVEERNRLGGRTLDRLELSDNPMTLAEARDLCRSVLEASADIAVKVDIETYSSIDPIVRAGQTIQTTIEGAPLLQVQRVEMSELSGVSEADGSAVWAMRITAGTVDRVEFITTRRQFRGGARLSLVDAANGDSESALKELSFSETATPQDAFTTSVCFDRTRKMLGTKMRCLIIA